MVPRQRPVTVLGKLHRWSDGVADLDVVGGPGEVHEPPLMPGNPVSLTAVVRVAEARAGYADHAPRY